MRVAIISLAVLGLVSDAFGADLDESVIRGSTPYEPGTPAYFNWSGLYAGGQIGFGNASANFGGGVSSLIGFMFRNTIIQAEGDISSWLTLPDQNTSSKSYGFFAGYNSQWDDVIVGVEVNYNRTNILSSSGDAIARSFTTSDGYFHNINLAGSASMNITDYGTLRDRGGYVFGRFLPYISLGVAVGHANIDHTATVRDVATLSGSPTLCLPLPCGSSLTQSEVKSAYPYGYELGLGLDVALMPGIILRGEYEYLQFGTFNDLRTNIQTVRVGAGVKF